MLTISGLISARRKELNLTIKELSKKTQISSTSLNKYEKGVVLPTVNNLNKITVALDLDYEQVFDILLKEKESRKN